MWVLSNAFYAENENSYRHIYSYIQTFGPSFYDMVHWLISDVNSGCLEHTNDYACDSVAHVNTHILFFQC